MSSLEAVLKTSFQHSCKCKYLISWGLVMTTKLSTVLFAVMKCPTDKANICSCTTNSGTVPGMLWIQLKHCHWFQNNLTHCQLSADKHETFCIKQPAEPCRAESNQHRDAFMTSRKRSSLCHTFQDNTLSHAQNTASLCKGCFTTRIACILIKECNTTCKIF